MTHCTQANKTHWVAEELRKGPQVSKVDVLDDQVLLVKRWKFMPFVAGIICEQRVSPDSIRPLIDSKHGVEIIANVPSTAIWTGSAIRLAQENNIATGVFGDLYKVLNVANVREFQQRETEFIERGLRQHNQVEGFVREYDKVYRICRKRGLPDLTAAMLDAYELTVDHIRTARDNYGNFDIAVSTNPNGSITSSALDTAKSMNIEILKWRDFFGRMNKK